MDDNDPIEPFVETTAKIPILQKLVKRVEKLEKCVKKSKICKKCSERYKCLTESEEKK